MGRAAVAATLVREDPVQRQDLGGEFSGEATLAADRAWGGPFPQAPGLYVVVMARVIPRLYGESDILYIGQAGKLVVRGGTSYQASLRQRWRDYWQGTTQTERDLRDTLIRLMHDGDVVVVVFTTEAATPEALARREAELLDRFFADHRELPPLNRAKPTLR